MADEPLATTSKNQDKKSRQRGPYNQYLSQPKAKIPRTTLKNWPGQNFAAAPNSTSLIDDLESTSGESNAECEASDDGNNDIYKLIESGVIIRNPMLDESQEELPLTYDEIEEDLLEDCDEYLEALDESNDEQKVDQNNEKIPRPEAMKNDFAANTRPIYDGAPISVAVSMLLIITFAVRHCLTGLAIIDLLTLVSLHCAIPNQCASSISMLKKFFMKLKNPIQLHYYCTFCMEYQGMVLPENKLCKNKFCLKNLEEKGNVSYFIIIPLICQLKDLIQKEGILSLLKYPVTRKKDDPDAIEDIQDGLLYKRHFGSDGFFKGTSNTKKSSEVHVSFQVNTDGVAIFKSSKYSIWPLYLVINELPPNCRYKRSNSIFLGLWFGYKKPDFLTFLQPLSKEFQDIYSKGVRICNSENKEFLLRGILLCGTSDAPAKCLLQNFVQFNGYYGCPYCKAKGEPVQTSARGHTITYPFNRDDPLTGHHTLRTHEETLTHAYQANKSKLEGNATPCDGVKGYSWFMFIPGFDIIKGMAMDYMHCVLLGVMKMLMTLWFDKSHSGEDFNISKKVEEVDKRLLHIRPPNCISRSPRSIANDYGHWKASEFRSFLFFYGVPCLWNVLPDENFQHFLLLVEAMWLLNQKSISSWSLIKAGNLLRHFCLRVEALYGKRYQTFNVHCLLHLQDCVRHIGPLWACSCFWFEDFNGDLRKLFHGTQKVDLQVALSVCIQQKIPELIPLLPFGSSCKDFFNHMTRGRYLLKCKRENITENIFALGTLSPTEIHGTLCARIETKVGSVLKMFKFKRVQINSDVVHCKEYLNISRRNSYTVYVDEVGFLEIDYYLKVHLKCPNALFCNDRCPCQYPHYLAVANSYMKLHDVSISSDSVTNCNVGHIIPARREECEYVFPVRSIKALCVLVDCNHPDQILFVCRLPNRYEKD